MLELMLALLVHEIQADIVVHKWAAIAKTHVFPVKPLVSLIFVRAAVAAVLAVTGLALCSLYTLLA